MKELTTHPLGETEAKALIPISGPVSLETIGGRIHADENPDATVTRWDI